jgi:phage-related holin
MKNGYLIATITTGLWVMLAQLLDWGRQGWASLTLLMQVFLLVATLNLCLSFIRSLNQSQFRSFRQNLFRISAVVLLVLVMEYLARLLNQNQLGFAPQIVTVWYLSYILLDTFKMLHDFGLPVPQIVVKALEKNIREEGEDADRRD